MFVGLRLSGCLAVILLTVELSAIEEPRIDPSSADQQTYAEILPDSAIFMLEFPNARQTFENFKNTPLGKFWTLPTTGKRYNGHDKPQMLDKQRLHKIIGEIIKLLDGKAVLALGAPETAELNELNPPLVYVVETRQPDALEVQTRALFEATGDPLSKTRRYGPFTINTHITAQTVFTSEAVIHALTQRGMEIFLDNRLNRPKKSLSPLLIEIRAAIPRYDCILYMAADGLGRLTDAAQFIDADQLKTLETLGFIPGSSWQAALALNSDGVEERFRLKVGGGDKNEGLLAVLKQMTAAVPPPQAGAPQVIDAIPWQAALLFSFQGDTTKHAVALAKSLRALDAVALPLPQKNRQTQTAEPKVAPQNDPTRQSKAKTLMQESVADFGDRLVSKNTNSTDLKPATSAVIYPHLARLEKFGLKLEQILEQTQGSVQLALFPEQIGAEAPDTLPIQWLLAIYLKNPTSIEQMLDAAVSVPAPPLRKEVLNGGAHYIEVAGDFGRRSGFWLKGNYLLYATDRVILDLAGLALLHEKGVERMTDRPSYKQAMATRRLDPEALLTIFGNADQVLEMPYKLAKAKWEEDANNPWPDYAQFKTLLEKKPILIQFKSMPDGLQGSAQTPLGLMGMFGVFWLPLKEAGF
ncbi:MAG: hypothetical protein V1899_04125 [Planctomycetota bacterium]